MKLFVALAVLCAYCLGGMTESIRNRLDRPTLVARCIPPAPAIKPEPLRATLPLRYDATVRQMGRDGITRTRYYTRPENRG